MRINFLQDLINKMRKRMPLFLPNIHIKYTKPSHTYKKLICITGFLYSGSGAVIDLLSEFENTTQICIRDEESSNIKQVSGQELGFFSEYGGVLDLEKTFEFYYPYLNDLAIKQFIAASEYHYKKGGIYTDEYMRLTKEFINNITEYKKNVNFYYGVVNEFLKKSIYEKKYKNLIAPFVKNRKNGNNIYFRKNLSISEYRNTAQKYITSFFKTIESKEFLILDQIFSNGYTDINLLHEYIGDFKNIAVFRDPRDVYVTAHKKKLVYVPDDVLAFINWYRHTVEPYMNIDHKDFLLIRFEDLILKYDETCAKILNFVNISKNLHSNKYKYLQPQISKNNIGIYKKYENKKDIDFIYENLKEFCYKGENMQNKQ